MGYNSQQKLRDNIEAIRIALELKPGTVPTEEQAGVLKKYSGFGGLKVVLFPNTSGEEWVNLKASKQDLSLYPQVLELHQLLQQSLSDSEYKLALDSLKNSILTAFYTPRIILSIIL